MVVRIGRIFTTIIPDEEVWSVERLGHEQYIFKLRSITFKTRVASNYVSL